VSKEFKGYRVLMENMQLKAFKVRKVLREFKGMDMLNFRALKVYREPRVFRAFRVSRGYKEYRVLKVFKAFRAFRA
jgi:tRNA A-37 threonylcarbamoyl transferase component Bud32